MATMEETLSTRRVLEDDSGVKLSEYLCEGRSGVPLFINGKKDFLWLRVGTGSDEGALLVFRIGGGVEIGRAHV